MFERGAARSTRSDTRVRRVCQCRGLRKGFMGLQPAPFDFCKSRCGSDDPATGTYSSRARMGAMVEYSHLSSERNFAFCSPGFEF